MLFSWFVRHFLVYEPMLVTTAAFSAASQQLDASPSVEQLVYPLRKLHINIQIYVSEVNGVSCWIVIIPVA